MLVGPILDTCWAKFGRGLEHIGTLKAEIDAWKDPKPYEFVGKESTDSTRFSFLVKVIKEPPLERWSLIASDALHNLRCSLDHLVAAIAFYQYRGSLGVKERRNLQFPICDEVAAWTRLRQGQIGPLSGEVQAAIESVQPWNRPHATLKPLLSILRDMDNLNKHRLLQLAMVNLTKGDLVVRYPRGLSWTHRIHTGVVEDGVEIAAAIFDEPAHGVECTFSASLSITLSVPRNVASTVERCDVRPFLEWIVDEVRAAIEIVSAAAQQRATPPSP